MQQLLWMSALSCTFLMHLRCQLAQFSCPCHDNLQLGQLSPGCHVLSVYNCTSTSICVFVCLIWVFSSIASNSIACRGSSSACPHSTTKIMPNFHVTDFLKANRLLLSCIEFSAVFSQLTSQFLVNFFMLFMQ